MADCSGLVPTFGPPCRYRTKSRWLMVDACSFILYLEDILAQTVWHCMVLEQNPKANKNWLPQHINPAIVISLCIWSKFYFSPCLQNEIRSARIRWNFNDSVVKLGHCSSKELDITSVTSLLVLSVYFLPYRPSNRSYLYYTWRGQKVRNASQYHEVQHNNTTKCRFQSKFKQIFRILHTQKMHCDCTHSRT